MSTIVSISIRDDKRQDETRQDEMRQDLTRQYEQQGNNRCNHLCSKTHIRVLRQESVLSESMSACKDMRAEQRIELLNRQGIKH